MIAQSFSYYKPATFKEAIDIFGQLQSEGKKPLYYAGGTEIISMTRKELLRPDALIDIKEIAECRELYEDGDYICYGSALPLTKVIEAPYFPLLSKVARTVADHTVRNRLTLGGNICGRLPYREAVLPFLLSDSLAVIGSKDGIRTESIATAYDKRFLLTEGDLLLQLKVDKQSAALPYHSIRKERNGSVDYPLLHAAAMYTDSGLKLAVSGLCAFPFRAELIEEALKGSILNTVQNKLNELLPSSIKQDHLASAEYRGALFNLALSELVSKKGGTVNA